MLGRTYYREHSIGSVKTCDGRVLAPSEYTMESETAYAKSIPVSHQKGYVPYRLATLGASRRIVARTFDWESVSEGAEFGCGAYGCFYNMLLPRKMKWKQFDINPRVVARNRIYTMTRMSNLLNFWNVPQTEVGSVYEMPLADSSVDVIAGLSFFDCIYFFEEAVKEVGRCLRAGGFFVHYQDLGHADAPLLWTEHEKRIRHGMKTDFTCGFRMEPVPHDFAGYEHVVEIDSADYGLVGLGMYLTLHLAGLFSRHGFGIHMAEETSEEIIKPGNFMRRVACGYPDYANHFLTAGGWIDFKHSPDVPAGHVKQEASMHVLVAEKL